MIEFEKSVFIQRSPQEVFDIITDPPKSTQWQTGVKSAEWTTEGPTGVGSTFKSRNRFLGRDLESDLIVTEWDPPRLVKIKAESEPIPVEISNKVESQGDGTLLTLMVQAEVGGFFKLAEGLAGKQIEKQVENDLNTLKLLLESNQL